MNLKNRITNLEKRVDVLEGRTVFEPPKKVSMRKIGWSYTKSKKDRDTAIIKGVEKEFFTMNSRK